MAILKVARLGHPVIREQAAPLTVEEIKSREFQELIEKLLSKTDHTILMVGLKRARKMTAPFSSSPRVVNLAEALSLRELIVLLSQCHLFVGNDSGPSHLAHALGIPAVVIASGTNKYEQWGIWNPPSKIVKHSVPCSPCHLNRCNVDGHPCLSRISSEEVFEAVRGLMSEVNV